MGKNANRNKLCRCGSGKKIKNCNCKLSTLDMAFPHGRVIDLGNGMYFHALGFYDSHQYAEFQNIEERKYAPFYSPEQIRKMLHPTTATDILLKKQADSIVDNMRIQRVFYNKYNRTQTWDYEHIIDDSIIDLFKALISLEEFYDDIKDIPCGMTYDSDPNGQCIKTQYGNIITISAILKEFLFYMNLFYMTFYRQDVPEDVTRHALVLAIRIMLQVEALDFELDPRGDIPPEINEELTTYTTFGILFILAHEYSHSILNHLDTRNIIETEDNYVYYNQNQLQEFEADKHAIHIMKSFTDEETALSYAVNFFMSIDLYEQVKEQISPSITHYKTHPEPVDRIKHLLEEFPNSQIDLAYLLEINTHIKQSLMDLVSTKFDLFETYGSVYLGQWHTIDRIDRVDY